MATPDIPGVSQTVLPGAYSTVQTLSSGASIPGGQRIAALIGQGQVNQVIVSTALGSGQDGLNPTYTAANGSDGRHFQLAGTDLITNRTQIFHNGVQQSGVEGNITATTTFADQYDYIVDISTGHLLLQAAYLEDLGGAFYEASSTNVGIGVVNGLTLIDVDAPSETWTIKCISVQRSSLNVPIAGTATFVAVGTVSGNKLDANGNTIIWIANNTTNNNGILEFSIQETASTPFREGDAFVVVVISGVLNANDSLTANFIPTGNINAPVFLQNMTQISQQFGAPSLNNNLTLGCQLAFSNGTPGIMCVQAAPPLPRRTSFILDTSMPANSLNAEDFIFPLPLGVVPDPDAQIHFFATSPTTNVETQLLPNQFPYYTLGTGGQPTTSAFIFSNTDPPGGNSFSYSVISQFESLVTAQDGYITLDPNYDATPYTHGIFTSSITFTEAYIGMVLNIVDSNTVSNIGQWVVNNVINGQLYVQLLQPLNLTNDPPTIVPATLTTARHYPDFIDNSATPVGQTAEVVNMTFELINPATGLLVTGSDGTDGQMVAGTNTGIATFTSTADVNFGTWGAAIVTDGYLLKIADTNYNNGLYLVTTYTPPGATGGTLTIQKYVATDSGMRYDVLNTAVAATNLVVVNKNIIPNLNQLRVTIVDTRDADFYDAGWINALASLETQQIDILVTLPNQTISVIFQNALNHCLTMSSTINRRERVLFLGAINGLTPSNLTGASLAAVEDLGAIEGIPDNDLNALLPGQTEDIQNYSVPDAFGNTFRAVYFYPDQIVVQAGTDNVLIDGFYIAAAAAGYTSGTSNIAMPMTNKIIGGLTILSNRMFSTLVLTQLANAGVTTLQPVQGGGLVVWGITTSQSGFIEEQEISIVFIRDHIAKTMRSGFADFVGLPQTNQLGSQLTARANAILNSYLAQQLITAYQDLTVVQDPINPTQFNISFLCQPSYPVDVIYIAVSIGLL
jgi:hypothetical protein